MKISYRNYPILEKLQKGSLGKLPISPGDQHYFASSEGQFFLDTWKKHLASFQCEVHLVSSAFESATMKAESKLLDLQQDIIMNDLADFIVQGTYVMQEFVVMIDYVTYQGSEDMLSCVVYMFDKSGIPMLFYIDDDGSGSSRTYISSFQNLGNDEKRVEAFVAYVMHSVNMVHMFKSYAEVETKFLKANTRNKSLRGKYVNDTLLDVTYLDSKWFTTLVQSDGFSVRGHFRLQPKKKDGKWTKELIWIDKFEKEGYTSVARKLKQDD